MSSFIKANGALGAALAAMTVISVAAVAQTTASPFAKKTKKQAWETDAVRPSADTPAYQAPTYQSPTYQAPTSEPSYEAPTYIPPPGYASPQTSASPVASAPTPSAYVPPAVYTAPTSSSASKSPFAPKPQTQTPAQYTGVSTSSGTYAPQPPYQAPNVKAQNDIPPPDRLPGYQNRNWSLAQNSGSGAYYPGRENKGGYSVPAYVPREHQGQYHHQGQHQYQAQAQVQASQPNQYGAPNNYGGQPYAAPQPQSRSAPSYGSNAGPNTRHGYPAQGWKEKLGLGNLATTFSAMLKIGVAAVNRKNTDQDNGWGAGFIGDAKVAGEISAITQGGLEYGVGGEIRGQYDKYRKGFGGKAGDCGAGSVANVLGCNTVIIDGVALPLRGHTSQFYSASTDIGGGEQFALEGAYLFLRSAYGDITVGRDDGAAYLFSLGAPTLLAVNASNSPVDYTGLDSVRTINDASGFSEKIAYVSPRLLGDSIGVGVQVGASYALNARSCGVDYCVKANGRDGSTALSPDLKDVLEFGIALDRTFSSGLRVEGTATYATASEDSGLQSAGVDVFDNLKSFGLGLEAEYGPWTLGGSFLNSNNGLQNGDYESYDIGLTWKPAQWGISASYGHATDKNVNLLSDQATLGFVYDFERFTLGTGVQYIERDVATTAGGLLAPRKEKATALFIEGGVKF